MSAASESSSGAIPTSPPSAPRPVFVTTHWSIVLSAQDRNSSESGEALETLCRIYWFPLYAFVRRQGRSPHDAQDLTQGFFARLIEKSYLQSADKEKGRFRTFLLVALKRFLANEWEHQRAQKRGGGALLVSIDQDVAESRFAAEASRHVQPDMLYDRQWAMTLLDRTLRRLRDEYAATGRTELFALLQNCFTRDESVLPYAEIAARLNLTEGAIKMAVHRLRARYREILRAEIADTVSSPEQVDDEIRHLFSTFGS